MLFRSAAAPNLGATRRRRKRPAPQAQRARTKAATSAQPAVKSQAEAVSHNSADQPEKPAVMRFGFTDAMRRSALANPRRVITAVRATEAFVDTREDDLAAARRTRPDAEDWSIELAHGQVLQRMLGDGAVHQGIAVQTKPLDQPDIAEIRSISDRSVVLALDQATDPRNVGAAIRAAEIGRASCRERV